MNRNYLPPSLKGPSRLSNSPPPSSSTSAYAYSQSVQSQNQQQAQMRRLGRACKLPTVQEVGK